MGGTREVGGATGEWEGGVGAGNSRDELPRKRISLSEEHRQLYTDHRKHLIVESSQRR